MRVFARTPLDAHAIPRPHGQVFLIPERCKGCRICVELCPQQVLQVSESTNSKGYHLPEVKPGQGDECVHCEFCTMVCPEFAIFTLEIEHE
jgi:2-oxoglutarate ferredoxin oxidoreductase subunit delta